MSTDMLHTDTLSRGLFRLGMYTLAFVLIILLFALAYITTDRGFYSSSIINDESFAKDTAHVTELLTKSFNHTYGRYVNHRTFTNFVGYSGTTARLDEVVFDRLRPISQKSYSVDLCAHEITTKDGQVLGADISFNFILYVTRGSILHPNNDGSLVYRKPVILIHMRPSDGAVTGTPFPGDIPVQYRRLFFHKLMHLIPATESGYIQLQDEEGLGENLLMLLEGARGEPTRISGSFSRMLVYSSSAATMGLFGDIVPVSTTTKGLTILEQTLGLAIFLLMLNEVRRIWGRICRGGLKSESDTVQSCKSPSRVPKGKPTKRMKNRGCG